MIEDRKKEICGLAARRALELPLLSSGFWFHSDIRDNFYYAIHLYKYCIEKELEAGWSKEKLEDAKGIALKMISKVLSLQVRDAQDHMYGHWPLDLGSDPSAAKPNQLPVELMGCLLILFYHQYQHQLSPGVKNDCYLAITTIYKSSLYARPLKDMNHHEAKHTSLMLLLGHFFHDQALMEKGLQRAKQQLLHIQRYGFKEYGALPWYWHWIQSFTCVWEVVEDTEVRQTMSSLLDYLWQLRADYYLKGTWVGPHSRQWAHDVPKDNNTLLDYIQFGDFPLPDEITRLEGAALYTYKVSNDIVQRAVNKMKPMEIKQKIQFAGSDGYVQEKAHTYVFTTPDYAVGGIWERRNEFDNEQKRWDITLPLTQATIVKRVNQAFFFHPGENYVYGDDRHASSFGKVMYHKDTVIEMWAIPAEEKRAYPHIVGCLPTGQWHFEHLSGYGQVEDVYLTYQLMNNSQTEKKPDRISITSSLISGWNGAIIEVVSCKDARDIGIYSLESFIAAVKEKNELSFITKSTVSEGVEEVSVFYRTWRNDTIRFSVNKSGSCERVLNNKPFSYKNNHT